MAAITAAMVKELREKTDAPMMECKKALTEADGDLAKAEEVLRVKLGSKASKAAARVTAEGLIGLWVSDDAKLAAVVEVNSETDFVAKNDDFVAFTKEVAELIAKSNPADVDALGALAFRDSTVDTVRTGLIGKIGENITVRRFTRIATENKVAQYVHGGRIGVLVEFSGDEALGKDLAMHIAATKPKALDTTGVSADDIQRERSVAEAKAAESGKPAEIITKMVEGSIQKFLKEVTLLSQPFVKDDKQTVEQVLKSKGSSIQQFVLYVVGEGIEKKANDFAAEVAAQVAASKG
ncbi:translation elongation factor Ts [Pigmentiphaga litoralis]|uniref:Elongation factor Ts n=1 Tax=Pigmentiphaga litoralis TaxID=516702 RepID=A0A7Y9IY55_9BURK|nr:translation elongation factor Ts [Pigmentiphaga litoralis]NYE22051.1 elongation factor Ts [Pigmentiphaga litoralis]NYE84334.1 elongation factor Ts [Pigmentiphaga litoralis]